jgi:hypothetical protein
VPLTSGASEREVNGMSDDEMWEKAGNEAERIMQKYGL